jgi:alpha-mannosidase
MREDRPSLPFRTIKACIEDDNVLYTRIHITKTVSSSRVDQDIILRKDSPRIEFRTKVDWHETQKMLRVLFPIDVNTSQARYDCAFGNIERPNHCSNSYDQAMFEVCGHKWGDVSDGNYGVALLNDCKYGYSIWNSDVELSLLRAANFPSPQRDEGIHTFSYWLYPHSGDIYGAKVAQAGYETNVPLSILPGNMPETPFIQTSADNLIVDTVKKAEDSDDLIVRIFETYNREGYRNLRFGFNVECCEECDLLERKISEQPVKDNMINFNLSPFEIKTFRIVPSKPN